MVTETERKLPPRFNPNDDGDYIADLVRATVGQAAVDIVGRHPRASNFNGNKQMECMLSGMLTSVFEVAFNGIDPKDRNEMSEWITKYLSHARMQVEHMIEFPDGEGIRH